MSNNGAFGGGLVEGNQVPESGPFRADIAGLTHQYKEVYQTCLQKIDSCSDDNVKGILKPLKQVMNDVWEQNQMLQDHCDDLEKSALRQMEKMASRLDQSTPVEGNSAQQRMDDSSLDVESLLKILKLMVLKSDITLDDYQFRTINRDEVEETLKDWKSFKRSMHDDAKAGQLRFSSPLVDGEKSDSYFIGENLENGGALGEREDKFDDTEYLTLAPEKKNDDLKNDRKSSGELEQEKDGFINDGESPGEPEKEEDDLRNDQECFCPSEKEKDDLKNDGKCSCAPEGEFLNENEGLRNDQEYCACEQDNGEIFLKIPCPLRNASLESTDMEISQLKSDVLKRERELSAVRESLKTSEANFQECKWALAAEVAEKHDQIVELRRVVATLEEKLRQADMQTHFKDDIIKKMRTELKTAKTSETKRLCDVVAELTERQRKMEMTGDVKFSNIQGALLEIVGNIEDALKSMPLEVARFEVERLAQIKRHLLHQPEQDVTDDGKVSRVGCSKDAVVGPLQDVINSLDDTIAVIKQNQKISENGDLDCDAKLETLGKDIRVVESQLSQIVGVGESSSEQDNGNQQMIDLAKLLDEILTALSVNTPQTESPTLFDVKHRISTLKDHLFNIRLPELRAQLASEQTMARNKEVTMQNLQTMVELREQQVQNFGRKVSDLEKQLEDQRQVIADLQRAVQDSKKMDLKMESDEICSLRFEVCELEMKQKSREREVQRSYEALERSQSENLNLRRKLQTVGEDLRDLRVEFNTCLQNTAHFESDNLYLEQALKSREAEIQVLQQQVQILEKEVETEQNRSEGRAAHDAKIVSTLRHKIDGLETQLRGLQEDYSEMLSNAEVKYLASKTHAAEQRHHLVVQNQDFAHNIRKLMYENETLHQQVTHHRVEEEAAKGELRRLQERQNENEGKIADLLQGAREWEERNKDLDKELRATVAKYERSQQQFVKIIQELTKKIEQEKHKEKQISEKFQERAEECEELKVKNKKLKMALREQENEWEHRDLSELNELEGTMRLMHKEMVDLKQKCAALAEELEKQTELRQRFEVELGNQQSLIVRVRDYEKRVIPEMAADLKRHKNIIENLKIKVKEANASCKQMRQESLNLIHGADFGSRKSSLGGDFRRSDQRLAVAVVQEPDNKTPDPWSPKPPAAHTVWQRQTRLSDSNEYFVESGFQSMLQSPVPTTPSYEYTEY